ncbi:MAG: hypothetical protein QOG75_7206 [Mycobacterium sp.]|jgi:hypothetical protein|nr:hypothetical protein [Mycobacterium sp.]
MTVTDRADVPNRLGRASRTVLFTAVSFVIGITLASAPVAGADKDVWDNDLMRCMSFGDSMKDCCYWANGGVYTKYPDGSEYCDLSNATTKPSGHSGPLAPTPGATAVLHPGSNTRVGIQ